jgi:hypothetical protein
VEEVAVVLWCYGGVGYLRRKEEARRKNSNHETNARTTQPLAKCAHHYREFLEINFSIIILVPPVFVK